MCWNSRQGCSLLCKATSVIVLNKKWCKRVNHFYSAPPSHFMGPAPHSNSEQESQESQVSSFHILAKSSESSKRKPTWMGQNLLALHQGNQEGSKISGWQPQPPNKVPPWSPATCTTWQKAGGRGTCSLLSLWNLFSPFSCLVLRPKGFPWRWRYYGSSIIN